jgi:hypothetical protein
MPVGVRAFAAVGAVVAAGFLGAGGCGGRDLTGSGGTAGISAGGHAGGIVLTGSGGSLTGAAGSGVGGGMECNTIAQTVQPVPPDILIVLDTSASMNDVFDGGSCAGGCGADSKWAQSVAAIEAVADASTPMFANWGLEPMSTSSSPCDATGVAVGVAPATGPSIRAALTSRSSSNGIAFPSNRPTRAAIDVAVTDRLAATDPGVQVIALVTDGAPGCKPGDADALASDADGAVQAIADAASQGIGTCVIGLGTAGGSADATLAQMAAAGMSACPISPAYVSVNAGAGLLATLNSIAAQGSACRYPAPPLPNDYTNPDWLAVFIDQTEVPRDATNGWAYVNGSLVFVLNGTACAASQGHTVSAAYHCLLQ